MLSRPITGCFFKDKRGVINIELFSFLEEIDVNKLLVFVSMFFLSGCAGTPRLSTTDLSSGMSRQEVLQKFGQPVNATMSNGTTYLIYEFNDHAYGRDDNSYALGFQNDRLVSVEPLPEDQQKMGPIDRALRSRRQHSGNGGSSIQVP
jgi:hypothetical protein